MFSLLCLILVRCLEKTKVSQLKDEYTFNAVIKGKLDLQDPHGLQIDGILLDRAYTDAHMSELLKLEEKQVEGRGTLRRHHCLPNEQCLVSGEVQSLESIQYIKGLEE